MQIDGRIWSMLSADAKNDYLSWYGRVYVTFGDQVQEVVLEPKPEAMSKVVAGQRSGNLSQPN